MASLPAFGLLWANYPIDHDPEAVKRTIGGRVNLPWIKNTCTIRISRAFNYAGAPIPRRHPTLSTVEGGDGLWYAFRVREQVPPCSRARSLEAYRCWDRGVVRERRSLPQASEWWLFLHRGNSMHGSVVS